MNLIEFLNGGDAMGPPGPNGYADASGCGIVGILPPNPVRRYCGICYSVNRGMDNVDVAYLCTYCKCFVYRIIAYNIDLVRETKKLIVPILENTIDEQTLKDWAGLMISKDPFNIVYYDTFDREKREFKIFDALYGVRIKCDDRILPHLRIEIPRTLNGKKVNYTKEGVTITDESIKEVLEQYRRASFILHAIIDYYCDGDDETKAFLISKIDKIPKNARRTN